MLLRMTDHRETRPDEQPLPERRTGWGDRFVGPEGDPRGEGGFDGERATLVGYLRNQRLTLELKCAGLDAEALARRSVPPSNMSLLGLVRHLAGVEQYWFREALAGEPAPPRHYRAGDDPDGDFNDAVADEEAVADAWKTWRCEVDFAERFVAAAPDLAVAGRHDDEAIALREVLVHMIEEYARHNGHADFLRERIDGRIGQ